MRASARLGRRTTVGLSRSEAATAALAGCVYGQTLCGVVARGERLWVWERHVSHGMGSRIEAKATLVVSDSDATHIVLDR